jgi:hypothetical protein
VVKRSSVLCWNVTWNAEGCLNGCREPTTLSSRKLCQTTMHVHKLDALIKWGPIWTMATVTVRRNGTEDDYLGSHDVKIWCDVSLRGKWFKVLLTGTEQRASVVVISASCAMQVTAARNRRQNGLCYVQLLVSGQCLSVFHTTVLFSISHYQISDINPCPYVYMLCTYGT